MATLNTLLDRLGTPPPEVCLDWAWQIENACGGKLEMPLDWSCIDLDGQGELRILGTEFQSTNSAQLSAQELVDQLLKWSHTESSSIAHPPASLAESTLQLAEAMRPSVTRVGSATAAAPKQSIKLRENSAGQSIWRRLSVRQRFGIATACLLLIAVGIVFALNRGSQEPSAVAQNDSANREERASPMETKIPSTEPLDPTLAQAEIDTPLQFQSEALEHLSDSQPADGFHDSELSGGLPDATDFALPTLDSLAPMAVTTTSPPSVAAADIAAEDPQPSAEENTSDRNRSVTEVTDVNLLAEMEKVMQQAEAQEVERDISDQDGSTAPALLLSTSPMNQMQKFPPKLTGGVREPQWSLRLEAGDGLTVTPAAAQLVSGKVATHWSIVNTEATTPTTQVFVLAQLQNARSPTLRWRIVAGAEDVPHIALPLGKEFLDAMQANLNYSSQRLQVGIEQLKAWGKTTGLPSEVRSAMSSQRRDFESQLQIGKRLLEIVADANQMDGWMDRQIAVHAELRDAKQPEVPPRIVFGSLELPATAAVENPQPE
ncbi:MAG: hypothetical protein R3C53_18220 [Pirellulaceae bacterium]